VVICLTSKTLPIVFIFGLRTYKRKKKPPVYTTIDLEKAVLAITSENKTYKQVSEEFKIPASVIFNRISGKYIYHCSCTYNNSYNKVRWYIYLP
jgi:hypothetical protein